MLITFILKIHMDFSVFLLTNIHEIKKMMFLQCP